MKHRGSVYVKVCEPKDRTREKTSEGHSMICLVPLILIPAKWEVMIKVP